LAMPQSDQQYQMGIKIVRVMYLKVYIPNPFSFSGIGHVHLK